MKALLVAGGSGGHLIPALTLGEHLKESWTCVMLSTARPMDKTIGSFSLVQWKTVDLQKFTPLTRWFSPRYAWRQLGAFRRVWSEVRAARPDVVVGFGGYLSAVGVAAARLQGVPTVVHEQNFVPGQANRLLSYLADAVAVSFPETKEYLPRKASVEFTGNPVRSGLGAVPRKEARAFFGCDMERPVLLVMGGSQGSRAINTLSLKMWEAQTPEKRRSVQVLHLSGAADAARVEQGYRQLGMQASVFPFLREIGCAYSAASLAIARAGATGMAELCALGLPAVLIPYPYAGGHQRANAKWMESCGGAVTLEEQGLTAERLWAEVGPLLSDEQRLRRMSESLRGRCDGAAAAERLGSLLLKVAG